MSSSSFALKGTYRDMIDKIATFRYENFRANFLLEVTATSAVMSSSSFALKGTYRDMIDKLATSRYENFKANFLLEVTNNVRCHVE